jgi:hypothetical protein
MSYAPRGSNNNIRVYIYIYIVAVMVIGLVAAAVYYCGIYELLLCNDCKMGGCTRTVSGQRLGKHVPVATQQILNNATVGLQQWRSCVFYVVGTERL